MKTPRGGATTTTIAVTSARNSSGITILKDDGEERRRCQEYRAPQQVNPSDLQGKRLVDGKKKKKKSKGPTIGTLMASSGTRIPVPLSEEKEQLQLREML